MLSITFLFSPVSVQQKGEWVQEESCRLRSNKFENEEHLGKGNPWSGIAAVGFCLLCGTWVNSPYYWASTEWENWLRWPQSPHAAFWPLWCWAGSSDMCVHIAASQLWCALCGMWSRMKKLKSVSSCCVPNNSIIFSCCPSCPWWALFQGLQKSASFYVALMSSFQNLVEGTENVSGEKGAIYLQSVCIYLPTLLLHSGNRKKIKYPVMRFW